MLTLLGVEHERISKETFWRRGMNVAWKIVRNRRLICIEKVLRQSQAVVWQEWGSPLAEH